jgi:hypothetical protein
VTSSGNALPTATLIGTGGRVAPKTAIYNDAAGNLNSVRWSPKIGQVAKRASHP